MRGVRTAFRRESLSRWQVIIEEMDLRGLLETYGFRSLDLNELQRCHLAPKTGCQR